MKIEFTKQAAKYFEKAPESLQRRLEKAIENILIGSGDIQPLVGGKTFFDFESAATVLFFMWTF